MAAVAGLIAPAAASARPQPTPAAAGEPAPGPAGEALTPPAAGGEAVSAQGERAARRALARERRAARHGGCRVQLSVQPAQLTAGERATLSGRLQCPTAEQAAEQQLTVYRHMAGTPGFSPEGTATTAADGSFQLASEPVAGNSAFYVAAQGVRSARQTVKAAPTVTISGPPEGSQLPVRGHRARSAGLSGAAVTFSGVVTPHDPGAHVVLQRESAGAGEQWRAIGFGQVGADGSYAITHSFARPGAIDLRVVVRASGSRAAASEPLSYVIAQRQNPLLTIAASADPLTYGQSLTISGVAAAGQGQALALGAISLRGLAPVADLSAFAGAGGSYSFAGLTPTRTTVYRVTDARARSTALLVTVRPVLSAQASASSLTAGQVLKVTGTIAPDHSGQPVYLQRQFASGIGYHTVQSAQVGPGSAYALEQPVSGSGPQVYRVKVPADGETQAAVSEPLHVQVTGASASAPAPAGEG